MTDFRVRPGCRLEWLGRARMAFGRDREDRDEVDQEAIRKWPDPPSTLVALDEIDPTLWPEHVEHRRREIEEAERKRKMASKQGSS